MTDNSAADRAQLVVSIRTLADFIEQHTDLPLPQSVRVQHSIIGELDTTTWKRTYPTDEQIIAVVTDAAEALSVEPTITETAAVLQYDQIAPRIDYTIHALLAAGRERRGGTS